MRTLFSPVVPILKTGETDQTFLPLPRKLDGYDVIKHELAVAGSAVVKRFIPTNGEELFFGLLFVGTMLCASIAHDTRMLFANLVLAVVVAVPEFLIVNANPDNHQIRRARIGVFLSVVFAALGFLLAKYGVSHNVDGVKHTLHSMTPSLPFGLTTWLQQSPDPRAGST